MSHQKESQDLGFGGSYQPVASRGPVDQITVKRSTKAQTAKPWMAKPWMVVTCVVIAGVLVFGFMKLLSSAGRDIAKHNQQVVGQVDIAKGADAQLTAHSALIAARTLFVEHASYADVNPASLSLTEPSFRYTSGASTGSKVVSVSSSATQVGLAVSAGKTCFYLSDTAAGTTYGSGTGACTGSAAISVAKATAW